MPQIEQTGGNAKEVVESYLEAIGSENLEQIYPELTEEQQVAAQKEQERQKQLQEMQVVVPLEAQAALGRAEELKAKARVLEAQANLMKTQAETGLTIAKTGTERAKTELTIEQAETEATKNATSIVGTELDIEKAKREAELVNIDRGQNNGNNPEPNTGMV
jgi:Skp family chaperone for outer membrane proteins